MLLHWIVTSVILVCILKKHLSKLVNFCVTILILKMKESTHFQHVMLYYFKKGKNTTETQNKICAGMEKVLGLIEHVQSGLRSLVLELSRWTMLQSGRPAAVDSDQIETFIENNQHCTTWEIADILKISKSIKLLVKMKNVSLILWKKPYRLIGQPKYF